MTKSIQEFKEKGKDSNKGRSGTLTPTILAYLKSSKVAHNLGDLAKAGNIDLAEKELKKKLLSVLYNLRKNHGIKQQEINGVIYYVNEELLGD